MKFSCEKSLLQTAITSASRAVSTHATMEVLKGLLFEASDDEILITGNNLQIGIQSKISAQVETAGRAVFDARMIGDIVRKLPDEELFLSVSDDFVVNVTCGMSEFNITALPSDSFPELPSVDADRDITVSQKVLRTMLSRTLFAVSENENKKIITGALFDIEKDVLSIVALDGYRLALCRESVITGNEENFSFVTPGPALREVERMLDDSEEKQVTIHMGARHILFSIDDNTLISRLLEGEFLNYKNAIPSKRSYKYSVNVKSFISSVERVSLLIDEKLKNPVRIRFGNDRVSLQCVTSMGRADDQFPCEGEDELEIGFNHRYLLDALKAVPDTDVYFETDSSLSPSVIIPFEDDSYLFMVLPVRLKDSK